MGLTLTSLNLEIEISAGRNNLTNFLPPAEILSLEEKLELFIHQSLSKEILKFLQSEGVGFRSPQLNLNINLEIQ